MHIIPIDDPDDPRVEPYRDIRERDLIGRDGLFVAEGEVVLSVLLSAASRFRPVSILVAAKRVTGLEPLLARAADVPVYAAGQAVLDRIAGFPMHRGILAIGRIGPALTVPALLAGLPRRAIVVVALGIANHDNVGAIFRNAAAFGAAGVILDRRSCHPLYRKAIRVSVGTALTQPFAVLQDGDDVLALLAEHCEQTLALSPRGPTDLAEVTPAGRVAVIVGAEGPGLPADILTRATAVRIPMAPGINSLNVATTTGIVLHHLAARRGET